MEDLNDFLKAVAKGKEASPTHQKLKQVKENVRGDLSSLFSQLAEAKKPVVDKPVEVPHVEEVKVDLTPLQEKIKELQGELTALREAQSFQQPQPAPVAPDLRDITNKLKFLEQAIGKIAATGPGGGAGEIYNLDMPSRTVTGDYTIDRKDYYIGVNCDVKSYITLPTSGRNLKNGRVIVIKDESGHAQLTPIKIIGTIDNDPNGAEIRINNGALQLIYRDGWRII